MILEQVCADMHSVLLRPLLTSTPLSDNVAAQFSRLVALQSRIEAPTYSCIPFLFFIDLQSLDKHVNEGNAETTRRLNNTMNMLDELISTLRYAAHAVQVSASHQTKGKSRPLDGEDDNA